MSVLKITNDNFNELVISSDKPVLLDFSAVWCGPCQMVAPILDEIAEERGDIVVGKIDVDDEPELARKFGVMSIPMLCVIRDGEMVEHVVGARGKADILKLLD